MAITSLFLAVLVFVLTWTSSYQQQPFFTGKCNSKLDLIIAIDGSNSMYENNFRTEKAAISNLIQSLRVTPYDIHVGLVLFSSDIHFHPLSGNAQQIIANLNAFQYPDDQTRTDLAIQKAEELFRNARHGDVNKVLIIVTDGRATHPGLAKREAEKLKMAGVWIYALGVTDAIDQAELSALATSRQQVLHSNNFQSLKTDLMKLAKEVCETATAPPPVPTMPIPKACNFHLDLIIAIDGSNSMLEENFKVQRAAIVNLVRHLNVGYNDIHVGLILFSNNVLSAQLNGNKQQVINDLSAFEYPDHSTRTDLAIVEAERLFTLARGRHVPKLLIIITDGRASYPQKALQAAQLLKGTGVSISVVGVTDAINHQELEAMASTPRQVFYSADFESLKRDVISAANEACEYVTTATLPPVTPKPVCHDRMDLVIALDGSNSMYEKNFNTEKRAVANLVDYLHVSPADIRVGLVLFSGDVKQRQLSGNKAQIKNDMLAFAYPDDSTRTDLAIQEAANLFGRSSRGSDIPKLLIIITDGRATYPQETLQAAQNAKNAGITIFVVGVTDAINEEELRALASSPRYVFFSSSFQNLQQDLVKAAKRACFSATG